MKTLTAPNGPSRPSAVPFWERKAIIIPSLVVFPLGLFLVWKSSWGNQKKWIYSGACVAFAIFCTVSMQMEKQEAAKKIAEANMFWEQGDQEKAITLYRELEDSLLFNIPKEHRPLMFGRLVDHEAKNGNTEEVRRLIKQASVLFKPDIRSDEAKQIVAQIEAEIEAEKHRPADQDEPNDSQSPVFSEGLAVVLKEGVWCVIDESLKTVGEVGVNSGAEFRPFSNDRAVYSIKVGDEPPDSGGVSDESDSGVELIPLPVSLDVSLPVSSSTSGFRFSIPAEIFFPV